MLFEADREEVAYFMRRLYQQKLTTTSGGNISFKVDEKHVLITPSQIDKGRLRGDQIGVVTIDGENLTPEFELSMETGMHLAIYKKRPDVLSVVHAHPAIATSFAVSHREINCDLTGETRALIGVPTLAPYALMGTDNLAEIVSEYAKNANAVLMENHGILTVGTSLLQAFNRLEVLEAAAKITLVSDLLGKKRELSSGSLTEIDDLMS